MAAAANNGMQAFLTALSSSLTEPKVANFLKGMGLRLSAENLLPAGSWPKGSNVMDEMMEGTLLSVLSELPAPVTFSTYCTMRLFYLKESHSAYSLRLPRPHHPRLSRCRAHETPNVPTTSYEFQCHCQDAVLMKLPMSRHLPTSFNVIVIELPAVHSSHSYIFT